MHCITSYIYKGNDESSCGYRTLINILSKFSAMKQYHNVINGTCFQNFLRILTNIFGADVSIIKVLELAQYNYIAIG